MVRVNSRDARSRSARCRSLRQTATCPCRSARRSRRWLPARSRHPRLPRDQMGLAQAWRGGEIEARERLARRQVGPASGADPPGRPVGHSVLAQRGQKAGRAPALPIGPARASSCQSRPMVGSRSEPSITGSLAASVMAGPGRQRSPAGAVAGRRRPGPGHHRDCRQVGRHGRDRGAGPSRSGSPPSPSTASRCSAS